MRSMPKSSCTMPIHPRSERMAFTSRPPQNALYFAWGKSKGSSMDPGEWRQALRHLGTQQGSRCPPRRAGTWVPRCGRSVQ
eukprot:8879557-Pyramimonas_sp.AAC.1